MKEKIENLEKRLMVAKDLKSKISATFSAIEVMKQDFIEYGLESRLVYLENDYKSMLSDNDGTIEKLEKQIESLKLAREGITSTLNTLKDDTVTIRLFNCDGERVDIAAQQLLREALMAGLLKFYAMQSGTEDLSAVIRVDAEPQGAGVQAEDRLRRPQSDVKVEITEPVFDEIAKKINEKLRQSILNEFKKG